MSELKLSIEIGAAVGSLMSGIIMLITFIRVVKQLKLRNEVIYGEDATKRYTEIKDTISEDGIEFKSIYEGGTNKIVPRLEVEKCYYNPILMKRILKGYKIRIRYFYKDGEIRNVITWYLKKTIK